MPIDVVRTAPNDWDDYVAAHRNTTAYHRRAAVAIGEQAFGLRTYFLCARQAGGRLQGVLPLVRQSSWAFGRFLTSVPFFTYGGVLADDSATAHDLIREAGRLGEAEKVRHVELRHRTALELNLPQRLDKVSMVLPLPKTIEELSASLGSKLRSQIRRADRESLEIAWGGSELLDEFYAIFAASMHRLGTPVYPRRFFDIVVQAFGDLSSVLVIRSRNEVQAAAIVVRHGDSIEVPWAAASEAAKRVSINMRMYWELLTFAIARNATSFDFGRSTVDSGTYRFKQQWGAKPLQLYWDYWLPAGAAIPKLNHANPKYELATRLWSRMPLWCANLLGPQIIRNLP